MFRGKKTPFIPDLSRFISSEGAHGKRWDLSSSCLAHYRFNEYVDGGDDSAAIIPDRSGKQGGMNVVTGSITLGSMLPALPPELSLDREMFTDNRGDPSTVYSAELIPGTDRRAIRPYPKRTFDFSTRGGRFLLQEGLQGIDPVSTKGCTFVFRFKFAKSSTSTFNELIFSISQLNTTQVSFSVTSTSGVPTIELRVFTNQSETAANVSITQQEWYTIVGCVKDGSTSLEAWKEADGSQRPKNAQSISGIPVTLTNPQIFVGYGDYNSSPNSSFNDSNDWGQCSRISELAIFDGWISDELSQAIGSGWSDGSPGTTTSHTARFNRHTSGLDNRGPRTVLKRMDNELRTYPSISRTGDQGRLGNEPVTPFSDEDTLVFTTDTPVMFPDMLPTYLYESTRQGHLRSYHSGSGDRSGDDHRIETRITASADLSHRVRPGLMNKEVFIMNMSGSTADAGLRGGVEGTMAPFDDSRIDTSLTTATIATAKETMLGFDQKLGDRIAIVIDLSSETDTTMGHRSTLLISPNSEGPYDSYPYPLSQDTVRHPDPASINSICYYNFNTKGWDVTGTVSLDEVGSAPSGGVEVPGTGASGSFLMASTSIAFAATTGFAISPDEAEPLLPLAARGRPTDWFGFPFDQKWDASDSQLLDMSKYISAPFLLEKMEITHDMEFIESGDDGLGYVVRDGSDPGTLLAVSSSDSSKAIPGRARADRGAGTTLVTTNDLQGDLGHVPGHGGEGIGTVLCGDTSLQNLTDKNGNEYPGAHVPPESASCLTGPQGGQRRYTNPRGPWLRYRMDHDPNFSGKIYDSHPEGCRDSADIGLGETLFAFDQLGRTPWDGFLRAVAPSAALTMPTLDRNQTPSRGLQGCSYAFNGGTNGFVIGSGSQMNSYIGPHNPYRGNNGQALAYGDIWFSMWFRYLGAGGGSYGRLFHFGDDSNTGLGNMAAFFYDAGPGPKLYFNANYYQPALTSSAGSMHEAQWGTNDVVIDPSNGAWYHLVLRFHPGEFAQSASRGEYTGTGNPASCQAWITSDLPGVTIEGEDAETVPAQWGTYKAMTATIDPSDYGSIYWAGFEDANHDCVIGNRNDGARGFNGQLADFQVWKMEEGCIPHTGDTDTNLSGSLRFFQNNDLGVTGARNRLGTTLPEWYMEAPSKYSPKAPGVLSHDVFSYGRFPLMGGMGGQHGDQANSHLSNLGKGMLLPSDDGFYKVVQNPMFAGGTPATQAPKTTFNGAIRELIPTMSVQTPGGVPFWRCDTFFLMRQAKGTVDRSSPQKAQYSTLASPQRSRQWPMEGRKKDWDPVVPDKFPITSVSTDKIRELITYGQIAHYGYTRSTSDCQAFKSGSSWQETHVLRSGMSGSTNKFYNVGASPRAGFPHSLFTTVKQQYLDPMGLGYRSPDSSGLPYADLRGGSRHPTKDMQNPAIKSEYVGLNFSNAYYPFQARYNTLGIDTANLATGKGGAPSANLQGLPTIFVGQPHSGSYEAGGGSFVSNPLLFVSEAAAVGLNEENATIGHGANDFFTWGGFGITGSLTGQTLLEAGLRRETSIRLDHGERFVKLWAADPTPGVLGWRGGVPRGVWDPATGDLVSTPWYKLKPSSAYLVATASREPWPTNVQYYHTASQNILSSGTFTMLTDIKNSNAAGAVAGGTFNTLFYQYDARWGPATTVGSYVTPVVPQNISDSEEGVFYPRESSYVHQIDEFTSVSHVFRSVGLSSGRSIVKSVPGDVPTSQKLSYVPSVKGVVTGAYSDFLESWDPRSFWGDYGWTGPIGSAHFVQTSSFQPSDFSNLRSTLTQQGNQAYSDWVAVSQYHLNQSLPYAPGADSEEWSTTFEALKSASTNNSGYFVAANAVTNWPFCIGAMTQTTGTLARTYTYNSPYVLEPGDKLVLGFQPAIGGMNEGAPKPLNSISGPFSRADEKGYQGVEGNDFSAKNDQSTPNYVPNEFRPGVNRRNLSEQIRQTVLKAGKARLVLYGTLLRDNKPHPAELNQPLVTNAVHEALHFDNPVMDQFLVDDKTAYSGSYLDQYITGSARYIPQDDKKDNPFSGDRNIYVRKVAATGWDGNLSFNKSLQRFVVLPDQSEVYWDSVLPTVSQIWKIDGKTPDTSGQNLFYRLQASTRYSDPSSSEGLAAVNNGWVGAFPFESRYDDVDRVLKDPADQSSYRTIPQPGLNYGWAQLIPRPFRWGWARLGPPRSLTAYLQSPLVKAAYASRGKLLTDPTLECRQSEDTADKAMAAALFGFATTGGAYFYDGSGYLSSTGGTTNGFTWNRKSLNTYAIPSSQQAFSMRLDHPEGVKYGLKNYVWSYTNAVFRPDRYGQLRDMLEQRRYTKFFNTGDDETPRGTGDAAVSCIFVDADGNPIDDASKTSCQNISTFMTSSIPYFEGEAQRTPTTNPFVSIDIGNMVSRTTLR